MKVKVKDLVPNPYRDIENYPKDKDKVSHLMDSISETGFWDNILARKSDGKFEIAYGHHRLWALQNYFKDEPEKVVNISVKELNNVQMIRIMANENHTNWGQNPKVLTETVKAARDFLEDAANEEVLNSLPGMNQRLRNLDYKIGAKVIAEFLGKNYTENAVTEALALAKKDEETNFDLSSTGAGWSMNKLNNFANLAVKAEATPKQQKKAAKEIGDKTGNPAEMKVILQKVVKKPTGHREKAYKTKSQELKLMHIAIKARMSGLTAKLKELKTFQEKNSDAEPDEKILKQFYEEKTALLDVLNKME